MNDTHVDLERLASEVAGLRDLFERRLREDRDKRRLYEELYELTGLARQDLRRQMLVPIVRELLLMIDRLESVNPENDACAEITEILARQGVERFGAVGELFDPQYHEAQSQEPAAAEHDGRVVRELRSGWLIEGRLLRPARVVVGRASSS